MPAFSQELFDTICERISGGESLRAICRDDDMPAAATVVRWVAADETLRQHYARAREAQADTIFDEILEIADDARNDYMDGKEGSAADVLNSENIQRSRLRIDARKWMAGKLRPKVYGDKVDLTHANPDGTPMNITQIVLRPADDTDSGS